MEVVRLHLIYLHQILLQSWHMPQSQVDTPRVQATQTKYYAHKRYITMGKLKIYVHMYCCPYLVTVYRESPFISESFEN